MEKHTIELLLDPTTIILITNISETVKIYTHVLGVHYEGTRYELILATGESLYTLGGNSGNLGGTAVEWDVL